MLMTSPKFVARGGQVTLCKTAYALPTQAAIAVQPTGTSRN